MQGPKTKRIGRFSSLLFAGVALFLFATTTQAGLIETIIDGNDCSGFFGQGFGNCNVFEESPVIAKFEVPPLDDDEDAIEINGLFDTVDGTEWTFTNFTSNMGTWTYNPGPGDPGIRFWAAKGANQFNFSYFVPDAMQETCESSPLMLTCIQAALVIPNGVPIDWNTGSNAGLSHISFYDSDGPDILMPIPGTLSLLLLGSAALVARRRRA